MLLLLILSALCAAGAVPPDAGAPEAPADAGSVVGTASPGAAAQDAGPPPCRQDIVSGETAWAGSLSFGRAEGRLRLLYRGPLEGSIGRQFPMRVSLSGRTLVVTLSSRSIPIDPGGKTLPAAGQNRGSVVLPDGLTGRYTLEVRQGRQRAKYELEVGEDVAVTPLREPPDGLQLSAPRWLHTPPDAVIVRCTPYRACGEARCAELLSSDLLARLPRVADGAYFDLFASDGSCIVHADEATAAALGARATAVNADGCGAASVTRAAAHR